MDPLGDALFLPIDWMTPGFVRGLVRFMSLLNFIPSWSAAGVVVILNVSLVLPEDTTGTVSASLVSDWVGGGVVAGPPGVVEVVGGW